MGKIFFVGGIDTNVGKSYATGWIASVWNSRGTRTITQKLVQTGNDGFSEDIELHRRIMGTGILPEDREMLTAPEIYTYPSSPHLAAEIDGRDIDFGKIAEASSELAGRYDAVLLEGAGGLMVPLTRSLLTVDYVREMGYPVILVTSGRLGSINHTLLSLESLKSRGMELAILAFNMFPEEEDDTISRDTREYLKGVLAKDFPEAGYMEIPLISL